MKLSSSRLKLLCLCMVFMATLSAVFFPGVAWATTPADESSSGELNGATSSLSSVSAESVVDFLFIESPEVVPGSTERVAVGFSCGTPTAATLEYEGSDGSYRVEASKLAGSAALFELDSNELGAGEYRLTSVLYVIDGIDYVIDLSGEASSARFTVSYPVEALSLSEGVSSTYWSTDDGTSVSDSSDLVSALADAGLSVTQGRSARSLKAPMVVALDPGHGGDDPGACANGLEEAAINLKIAMYCKQELESLGYTVVMTRSSDVYVGLEERVEIAREKGALLFVSFHINSGGGRGVEVWIPAESTWYSSFNEFGEELGDEILERLVALGFSDRGLQSDYYYENPDGSPADYLSVIRNSRKYGIPAVLIEHGFIDSSSDAAYLSKDANLKKLGVADAKAIASVSLPGGLIQDGKGYRYLQEDGTFATSAWKDWQGERYYFDESGYAVKWAQEIEGSHYYFDGSCRMVTGLVEWNAGGMSFFGEDGKRVESGWANSGGSRYYISEGYCVRWSQEIDGSSYYFDSKCRMYTGPLKWNAGGWSVFDGEGRRVEDGWHAASDGSRYYAVDGYLLQWAQEIDGGLYYFDSQCRMVTGWVTWNVDSTRTYFAADGAALVGWQEVEGETYYFDPDNGCHGARWLTVVDGSSYYFDSKCRMHTGWLKWNADGKWSYFGSDGAMYTGTHTIDGVTYTFDADGKTSQYFARVS